MTTNWMSEEEYLDWCKEKDYLTSTDWNWQLIGTSVFFFIINPYMDVFALIEKYCDDNLFRVLIEDWQDFNGYAEEFHKETEDFYK